MEQGVGWSMETGETIMWASSSISTELARLMVEINEMITITITITTATTIMTTTSATTIYNHNLGSYYLQIATTIWVATTSDSHK